MPWALLLDLRVLLGAALIATGIYAKVQNLEKQQAETNLAQFRADVESEAAKAKVAAAREALRHAENTTEVISGLQTDNAALRARYDRLRASAGSRTVSAIPGASGQPSACPGGTVESDTLTRCLAATEWGDRELAKYAELWKLWRQNAKSN